MYDIIYMMRCKVFAWKYWNYWFGEDSSSSFSRSSISPSQSCSSPDAFPVGEVSPSTSKSCRETTHLVITVQITWSAVYRKCCFTSITYPESSTICWWQSHLYKSNYYYGPASITYSTLMCYSPLTILFLFLVPTVSLLELLRLDE